MAKMWKDKKRVLCLLLIGVLTLGGGLGYLFQLSKDEGITSEAGAYRNGLTNFSGTGAAPIAMIDHAYIANGNIAITDNSLGCVQITDEFGQTAWALDYTLYTNQTTDEHKVTASNPPGLLCTTNVGEWNDSAGNIRVARQYNGIIPGQLTMKFPNAIYYPATGQRATLVMTLSNFTVAIRNNHKKCVRPCFLNLYDNAGLQFAARRSVDNDHNSECGFSYDVTCSVEGAPVAGNVMITFKDIDQPSINGRQGEEGTHYDEGFILGANCHPHVATEPNSTVNFYTDGTIRGTCDANGGKESAISIVGPYYGFAFRWSGANCATSIGLNASSSLFDMVTAQTDVYYEMADGSESWGGTAHSASVIYGMIYQYTWPADFTYHNVYYNPASFYVAGECYSNPTYFAIHVPRRWYLYNFDFDTYCPSGHTSSEITNKQGDINYRAENWSGDIINPALTGYTFLGFSDAWGNGYANEQMLSNRTFYATWRKNKYKVRYHGNGSTDYSHQTGEFTQHTVKGTMDDSDYEYDTEGKLRKNTYTRCGYEFVGWNTKADGTGTSYTDENRVYNWTTTDGDIIHLYAQWKKHYGKETITVVSEETGNPVKGVTMRLEKNVNGTWITIHSGITTPEDGKITVSNLHWFDYRWVMTSVPAGYMKDTETPSDCYMTAPDLTFRIKPCGTCTKADCDNLTVTNRVILYMKHVNIILYSEVDCIVPGEDPPAFVYHISGTDAAGVNHQYNVVVQTGSSKTGSYSVNETMNYPKLFAGTYTVTQTPVSRYVPGTAVNVSNATINGISAAVDVLNNTSGSVRFPYTLTNHGWYYGVESKRNSLRK